jgi:ubiquinone/menaquinone biosynthesis C-methylase UbiE
MLTVDYDRLGVGPGTKVIDVGCGAGRHSYEAYRRGADVIAFDQNAEELAEVDTMLQAMGAAGEAPESAKAQVVVGDALALPYPDGTFDVVIASEILEHVPEDDAAIAELVRVLRPGAVSPSRSRGGCRRKFAGCCRTPITPMRVATSGSTRPMNCSRRWSPGVRPSPDPLMPTHFTHRIGG